MRRSLGEAMTDIYIGDWVRFYLLGQFTIAEIRYVKHGLSAKEDFFCTDQGEVRRADILEVRHAP